LCGAEEVLARGERLVRIVEHRAALQLVVAAAAARPEPPGQ